MGKDYLPESVGQSPGLQAVVYGVVLVAFVMFEPHGPVRPLAEDPHLPADVPVLPRGHVQAAEVLPEVGPAEMSEPLLSAKDLTVRFGGLVAVNNVSFDVQRGEVFTLIGPNGAGKTTVFNLISRIYQPTAGGIRFEGEDLIAQPPHAVAALGIARTFQNIELFEFASVLQNLLIGTHTHRRTSLWQDLLFTGATRRAEIHARAEGRAGDRLPRPAALPRLDGRRACPTACARWSNWRARCAPSRSCCCWTSRRRA